MSDDKPSSAGTRMLDGLEAGLRKGDPAARQVAATLGKEIFEEKHGRNDTYLVQGKTRELNEIGKVLNLNDSEKNRLHDIVRSTYPPDRPLTASQEGPYGSERFVRAQAREKESYEKLRIVTTADTSLGSLLSSLVQASGGTVDQMKAAAAAGRIIEGAASMAGIRGRSPTRRKPARRHLNREPPRRPRRRLVSRGRPRHRLTTTTHHRNPRNHRQSGTTPQPAHPPTTATQEPPANPAQPTTQHTTTTTANPGTPQIRHNPPPSSPPPTTATPGTTANPAQPTPSSPPPATTPLKLRERLRRTPSQLPRLPRRSWRTDS
ncbi:hypothetical protein I547_5804 [Mycobacterium kansasii 824]|nr:hypothetical protein I547_5804 [Mycobacterium kansasii 824]